MNLDGVALRAVVGGWVVVASLVVWSYSGLLVSVMTVRLVPRPIKTARDLLDHSRARVIMRANTAYTDTLAVSLPPCERFCDLNPSKRTPHLAPLRPCLLTLKVYDRVILQSLIQL